MRGKKDIHKIIEMPYDTKGYSCPTKGDNKEYDMTIKKTLAAV